MENSAHRLRSARLAAGFKTVREAVNRFGWKYTTYNAHETGQNSIRPEAAREYAKAFKVDPSWLMLLTDGLPKPPAKPRPKFGISFTSPYSVAARIVGKIETGVFRDIGEFDCETDNVMPAIQDPEFPTADYIAFVMADDSMDALEPHPIVEGDRVVGVDIETAPSLFPLEDGMLVVVEHVRDNGRLKELSIKQVENYEDKVHLFPRSKNQKYMPVIVSKEGVGVDDPRIRVIAVVSQLQHTWSLFGRR